MRSNDRLTSVVGLTLGLGGQSPRGGRWTRASGEGSDWGEGRGGER